MPSPSPCLTPDQLYAAADAPSTLQTDHLATCSACRGAVEAIRADNDLVAELVGAAARPSSPSFPTVILGPTRVQSTPDALPPGTRIGRYTILSTLGVGGMGMVYRAEQDAPRRPVALKLIRPDLASPSVIRRFEHEAAALALLKHPGIAQVYEAGIAEEGGTPYFAMELVEGQRLDHFVQQHRPSRQAILLLVAALADAADHAHRKGVIHRDLKPANIVVEGGGEWQSGKVTKWQSERSPEPQHASSTSPLSPPLPRILDFGVAKLRDTSLNIEATQADSGGFVGTLAYAAPEQVSGLTSDPAAIDARADVYALGVILYELLVGQRPYSLDGSLHTAITTISEARIVAPESRGVRLDADLRTIVYKSLAADPDRRYQSAAALAEDIRRYLDKRPLRARPDSTLYTLRMAVVRHPYRAATAGAFVVLAMTAAAVSITLQLRAAAAASQAAAAARLQAGVSDSFLDAMRKADQDDDETAQVWAIDDLFGTFASSIDEKLGDHPKERADLLLRLGRATLSHRQFDLAIRMLTDVVAQRRSEQSAPPERLAEALHALGRAHGLKGEHETAHRLLSEAHGIRSSALGSFNDLTLDSLHSIAGNLAGWRRYPEAEEILKEVVKLLRETEPDSSRLAKALNDLSACIRPQARSEEALDFARQALAQIERTMGAEHKHVPVAIANIVANLIDLKRYDEAEPLIARAIDIRKKLFAPDDPRIADSNIQLAGLKMRRGDSGQTPEQRDLLVAAAELADQALATRRRIYSGDHNAIAEALSILGQVRMRQGQFHQSCPLLREAMEMRTRLPRRHDGDLGHSESLLGECLRRSGDTATAAPLLRSGLDKVVATYGPEHPRTRDARKRLEDAGTP